MKHVKLKKLVLTNWKGAKDLEINFSDVTSIFGDNGTGKSRNFAAFSWLLFGKDQFDRKDHEILTIENGKVLDRVDAEVFGILDVDGEEITLRRIYKQVWQRKRGEEIQRMTKHETEYFCNDVPLKAAEYKAKVDSIIDETVFKLITNPSFFLGLKWEKQREHLFQMAGTITDEQIAATSPEFRAFLDSLSGRSFEEHRKTVKARKKKLEEALAEISPRIDQVNKMMPEDQDFTALKEELNKVEGEIRDIDSSMTDKAAAVRQQYEAIQAIQREIGQLKTQQQTVVQKAKETAQNEAFEKNSQRRDLENDLTTAKSNLSHAQTIQSETEKAIKALDGKNETTEAEIGQLRVKFQTENAKSYTAKEGCLVCPVFHVNCGDTSVVGKHKEAQEAAQKAFFDNKKKILDGINDQGLALSETLKNQKFELTEKQRELESAKQNVVSLQSEVDRLQKLFNETPVVTPVNIVPEELEEWKTIAGQIAAKEAQIQDVKPVDNTELTEKKKGLENRRDELKKAIGKEEMIAKYKEEISKLDEKGKDLSQQIADLEKDIFVIDNFSKTKIKECHSRINGLFQVVNFQLFDTTIENKDDEDKVFETCIAKNKSGVPISTTNTAEKVNAGLDIINALCRFHNVTAPIFIDGRESVNELIPTESQIVNLIVLQPQFKCDLCGEIKHSDKNDCECGSSEFTNITPKGLIIQ